MQYTVDFGRTADRIQMEATKSTTGSPPLTRERRC